MSGPQHYQEAERIALAAQSLDVANREGFTGWTRSDLAALAHVHATLALASATALDATNALPPSSSLAAQWEPVVGS